MKSKSMVFLATLLPLSMFAQAQIDYESLNYDETVYVFRTSPMSGPSEFIEECNELIGANLIDGIEIGGLPDIAAMVELHSVHTKKTDGSLKKPIKKIGEMLVCQDRDANPPEANQIPVFYSVRLDGLTLNAEGGGTSIVFPGTLPGGGQTMAPQEPALNLFYPVPGVALENYSATIIPSFPPGDFGIFISGGRGGNMVINAITNFVQDERFETEGIGVIRFFQPIDGDD